MGQNNILIVATTSWAGMGPYTSEIINCFYPDDNVYYFLHDYEDDYYRKNVNGDLFSHCCFFKSPNSKWNKVKGLVGISVYGNRIYNYCKEKNISIAHFINCSPGKRMQDSLAKIGVKTLSTVHDLHPHESKKEWYKMLRQRVSNRRLKDNVSYSKYLTTNSTLQYDELKSLYPSKSISCFSFPSLVTSAIMLGSCVSEELRNVNKPYLLFFGRIEAYKGVDLLIDAFLSSGYIRNKYNLVIAGSGLITNPRANSEGIILLNRYIKDEEVSCLYQNASMVVYPYVSATQSGVLSLSFYYTIPTIVSDIDFFKGIVEDNGTALVFKSGNVDSLVAAIKEIDSMDVEPMKLAQTSYYKTYYSNQAIRTQLLEIYESINSQ